MTPVEGSGPIEFNDVHGRMLAASLEAFMEDTGVVVPIGTWSVSGLSAADVAMVKAVAQALASSGMIRAASPSPAKPAMTVSTVDPIPVAATVRVTVAAVTRSADADVSKTTFTLTVDERAEWQLLTTADLVSRIGTSTRGALVHVDPVTPPVPDTLPAAAVVPITGTTVNIDDASGTPAPIFTLATRDGDSEGLITVETSDIDSTAKTFTLSASWTKTVAGVQVATAAADLAALAYSVVVAPPTAGGPFRAPAEDVTTLAGGGTTPARAVLAGS